VKTLITIYVVRHGQTEFNVKKIIGGTLEPNPLSKIGKKQAYKLGKKFKDVKIDFIYSSDLSRARETAEIIASFKNMPVSIDKLLRERRWGKLQGKIFDEAQKIYKKAFIKEAKIEGEDALNFKYVPDMESLKNTVNRFKRFLKKMVVKHPGKITLVVCHFDIMIGFLVSIGFGSYQELMNSKFDHAGYYKLTYQKGNFSVEEIIGLNKNISP